MSIKIPIAGVASKEAIATLEKSIQKSLPESYWKFIQLHDGAKPEQNVFTFPGNSAGIEEFTPVSSALALRKKTDGFPEHGIPIARATGGNFVFLDPADWAVYFWDHEIDAPYVRLAKSFDQFLKELQPFDINKIKLKSGQVKQVWVDPNFRPEF